MNLLMVKDLGKIESLLKRQREFYRWRVSRRESHKEVTHKEAGDKENVKSRSNEPAMLAVEFVNTHEILPNHSTLINMDNLNESVDGERFRKDRELAEETKGVDTVGVFQDESLIKEVAHKEAGDKENVKSRSNERAMLAVEVVRFFFFFLKIMCDCLCDVPFIDLVACQL
ncbi:hypothetical protein Hanom_Chr16g01473761 [Helianthus anomalus]